MVAPVTKDGILIQERGGENGGGNANTVEWRRGEENKVVGRQIRSLRSGHLYTTFATILSQNVRLAKWVDLQAPHFYRSFPPSIFHQL